MLFGNLSVGMFKKTNNVEIIAIKLTFVKCLHYNDLLFIFLSTKHTKTLEYDSELPLAFHF
jgi:hypothetical protein